MGVKSAWNSFWSEGSVSNAFNYLVTDEDAIETQKLVTNAQQAKVVEQYQKGLIDVQEAGELMNLSAGSAYPFLWKNEKGGDPASVFVGSVKANATGLWTNSFGAVSKLLPWWVWALLILGAVIYFWPVLGAALALRGKFAK